VSFKNHQRKLKTAAVIQRFYAYHEAAHAVVALALGAELAPEAAARLLPKPKVGIVNASIDDYQAATIAMAGPMSDFFCGLVRADDPLTRERMIEALDNKDLQLIVGCAVSAAEVNTESPSETEKAAMLAWGIALDIVCNRLTCANWDSIKAVARALLASPKGLTAAEVRQHAGPLRTVTREQLHAAIDQLARGGLEHERDLIAYGRRVTRRVACLRVS
jgi:hypothetical protein